MHKADGTFGPQAPGEPRDLASREVQVRGRVGDRELTREDVGQDKEALLRPGVQRDRLPRFHGIEGDKVAVPLARTDSLSYDT